MPIWTRPASLAEVRALFGEGRMQLGRKAARGTLDAARAIAGLGVARGVTAFERFGYFERNGQANLAVPLGRFEVKPRPEVRLLDEIEDWTRDLQRSAAQTHAPASVGRVARRLDAAMLDVAQQSSAHRWQRLLAALGEAEATLLAGPRFAVERRAKPLPPLSSGWLDQADDGSAELWLAVAIASQRADAKHRLGPLRAHLMPLDENKGFAQLAAGSDALRDDPRVVMRGLELVADLEAVVSRRLVESHRAGSDRILLDGAVAAPLADVEDFVFGNVNDGRILALIRPLTALRWTDGEVTARAAQRRRVRGRVLSPLAALALFRAAYRTVDHPEARSTTLDSTAFAQLRAGRLADAARTALARLEGQGLRPRLSRIVGSPALGHRIAASLAIPLSLADQRRAVDTVCKPTAIDARSENGEAS